MFTPYHAKYFAYELTNRSSSDSMQKLASTLVDAQVDLNPHQVEASLFAFRSPLSKGALLADEVGLGKTIEAGLVISQKWAERKRRILVITPSNLRKQWHQELQEKFFIPCKILETRSYNEAIKQGNFKPFVAKDLIVICSYQFARNKAADVNAIGWDLVVIDEAHRLRNVYKPSNVIANTLKQALKEAPKILLTAQTQAESLEDELDKDYEALGETAEEWPEDTPEPLSAEDRTAIEREIADLESFRELAVSIKQNAKGRALLAALDKAFAEAKRLGASRKAIVLTESRRTQEYLLRVLADSPYSEGIV